MGCAAFLIFAFHLTCLQGVSTGFKGNLLFSDCDLSLISKIRSAGLESNVMKCNRMKFLISSCTGGGSSELLCHPTAIGHLTNYVFCSCKSSTPDLLS